MEKDELLEKLYYDLNQGSSLGSVDALFHSAKRKNKKITKKEVREWLKGQRVYSLHRPAIKHFRRNRVLVGSIDSVWELDLIDMQSLKKYNSNYRYMLTCIDVLSKYAWAIPIKDKSGPTLVKAFKQVLDESGRKPKKIHTDRGSEFTNRVFQTFLKERNIGSYHTFNDVKAFIIERLNRTLKQRMYRYFTWKGTLKYIDVLAELVHAYNTSYHRSIKRAPASVTKNDAKEVWQTLYGNTLVRRPPYKFEIAERVRISKSKKLFDKGYLPNWSEEMFTIFKRIPRNPPVYKLKEFDGDVLEGTFYEQELQRVNTEGEEEVYKIETILRTRKRGKQKEYFVKWLGYPDKYNSWVLSSDIE